MSREETRSLENSGRLALMTLVATLVLSQPSGLFAASPAPVRWMPQASDTIPLAPVEVRLLRTPILQDAAPLPVSALTGRDLQRGRSGFFLADALQLLPGVQVQNRFNPAVGERVAIRGFGARATFGLRGIRVVVDGIPATLPDGQSSLDHLDIGSLGRVEALRGPASALYGNAAGGVLAFSSRAPAPTPFDTEVMGVTGSDGLWRGQLIASGTVDETGYLVTVSGQRWDGYRTIALNPARPRQDTLGTNYGGSDRLGFNARVTTPLAGGALSLTANALDLEAENAGSKADDPDTPFREINDLYLRFRTGKSLRQQQAGVRWEGPLGGTLQADVSAYGVHRTINNPIPFDVIDLARKGGGVRAQLGSTVSTGSADFNWQGGFEYDLQNDDRSEIARGFGTGQPAPGATPFLDQAENVRSAGVFFQGTLELSGGAIVLAGLRYDNHDFTAEDRVPVTETNAADSGTRTMDAVSPSIGVSIPAGPSVNFFGSISTVFETPTTSELSNQPDAAGGFNPDLDPMRGESFELGIRGSLGSNAVFEVTGYNTNLRNELVRFELEGFDDVGFFRNSGESRHRGLEATLSAASRDGIVRADVTYAHIDAQFKQFTNLDGDDLSGNQIPGVSPNRGQAVVRLNPGRAWVEIGGTYVDEVPVDDENTVTAPSYFLVDVRAGLDEVVLGNMKISPWVALTNALDEDYVASVAVNAFGSRFFEPGPDMSFQVGFRASWN
jgi:iron complex outermembrane receptor protein